MKKEKWEVIATYIFTAAAVVLYLIGFAVQLELGFLATEVVVADYLLPFAVAFVAYMINRRFRIFCRLCEWAEEIKLLGLCLPAILIAFAFLVNDNYFMRVYFPVWAILAMACMPSIFKRNVEHSLVGIVLSAVAFAWTELLLGDGIGGLLTTLYAALLLIMATVNADSFGDTHKTAKEVVAGLSLVCGLTILLFTPTGLFALLKAAYSIKIDYFRETALVAAENVLVFLVSKVGSQALLVILVLLVFFVATGGELAFANQSYTRFFAVGAWAVMSQQSVSYVLFSMGYDTIFPLWCPLLDAKQAPMNTLVWMLLFAILHPHHLLRYGGRYDNSRPVWNLDEYIVSHMSQEELIQALTDEDYVSFAWHRLTTEFVLSEAREEEMLQMLKFNRKNAQLLKNYVVESQAGFHVWRHLLIYFGEFLTDEECTDILDSFIEIFGENIFGGEGHEMPERSDAGAAGEGPFHDGTFAETLQF